MFAAFPIGLFLIGAVVLVNLPVGFRLQSISSQSWPPYGRPENHEPVTVELDNKFALKTALRGENRNGSNPACVGLKRASAARAVWRKSIRHWKISSATYRSGTRARIARCATVR